MGPSEIALEPGCFVLKLTWGVPPARVPARAASGEGPGVHVAEILEDPSDFKLRQNPGHPHAIREGPLAGYVQYPNVNITMEYVNAMEAARAYEANVAVMNVNKTMIRQAIQLFA